MLDFKAYQQKTLQLGPTGVYKMADRPTTATDVVIVSKHCSLA